MLCVVGAVKQLVEVLVYPIASNSIALGAVLRGVPIAHRGDLAELSAKIDDDAIQEHLAVQMQRGLFDEADRVDGELFKAVVC